MASNPGMAILVQSVVLNSDDQIGLALAKDFFPNAGDSAQVKSEEQVVGRLE